MPRHPRHLVALILTAASIHACTDRQQPTKVQLRCQFEGREKALHVSWLLDLEKGTATRIAENVPPEQSVWTGSAKSGGVIARNEEYSIWMVSHVESMPELDSTWRWSVNRKTGDATMSVSYGVDDKSPSDSQGHCSSESMP